MEFQVGDRVRVVSRIAPGAVGEVMLVNSAAPCYPVVVALPDGATAFDHDELTYADGHSHVTDVPSPEADREGSSDPSGQTVSHAALSAALDRIAEVVRAWQGRGMTSNVAALFDVQGILRETGRLS